MRLVKLLIALVALHLGCGFTQVAASYYGGDFVDYGARGFVSHTPIGPMINLDGNRQTGGQESNPLNPTAMFRRANAIGDSINNLASFGYGFLKEIAPEDGFIYTVVMTFRIVSALIWIALGLALVYFVFDSNLHTSKLGLGLLLGGGAVTSLSALGGLA